MATGKHPLAHFEPGSYRVNPPASAREVVGLVREQGIQIVDLKFTDLPGLWQHFSIGLPELEVFIFDSIRFDQNAHCGYYYVDSAEGAWNSGRDEGAFGGGTGK